MEQADCAGRRPYPSPWRHGPPRPVGQQALQDTVSIRLRVLFPIQALHRRSEKRAHEEPGLQGVVGHMDLAAAGSSEHRRHPAHFLSDRDLVKHQGGDHLRTAAWMQ